MTYETLLYDVNEGVATITLNRGEVMNGLNGQMRVELMHAFRRAADEARVIVTTGAGRGYCSGQDLGDRKNMADIDLERTLRDEYVPLLEIIYDCPLPTIAAVNGPAAGAGANLALAHDVVIAKEDAIFIQAFARIGLIPDAGGTFWLPRQIGAARAMGAALFAEPISGREAADMGMIWEAVSDAKFDAHVIDRALKLSKGPTKTYEYIKTAMRKSSENSLEDQLSLEAELQGKAGKTRDFLEGILAFSEKRDAKFEGR